MYHELSLPQLSAKISLFRRPNCKIASYLQSYVLNCFQPQNTPVNLCLGLALPRKIQSSFTFAPNNPLHSFHANQTVRLHYYAHYIEQFPCHSIFCQIISRVCMRRPQVDSLSYLFLKGGFQRGVFKEGFLQLVADQYLCEKTCNVAIRTSEKIILANSCSTVSFWMTPQV